MTEAAVPTRAPFVVIGAGMAGGRAAAALAKSTRQPVILVGGEKAVPYDRPALSKAVLLGEAGASDIALQRPGQLQGLGVAPVLGRRACGLDPNKRVVELDDGTAVAYGQLLVATGRRARMLDIAGASLAGVHTLRELDDAQVLAQALRTGGRVVVVGAGLIGLEVAAAAEHHGCTVTVVDLLDRPLGGRLPEAVGNAVRQWHEEMGTDLRFGDRPTAFVGGDALSGVTLAGGDHLPADHVVVGVGSEPCTDWADALPVAPDGTLPVDDEGRTAVEGIWACGDVASWDDPTFGRLTVEHETVAQAHARRVAMALAGRAPGPAPVPFGWSEQLGRRVEVAGATWGEPDLVPVPGTTGVVVAHRGPDGVVGVATAGAPGVATRVLQRMQRREQTTIDDVVGIVADTFPGGLLGPRDGQRDGAEDKEARWAR